MAQTVDHNKWQHVTEEMARAVVPSERWDSFHSWALETGYYDPKPPYRGLRAENGSEWAGHFVFGKLAHEILDIGATLCLGDRKTYRVVP